MWITHNPETGEIRLKQKKFTKVFVSELKRVAQDKELTGLSYRCLLYLIAEMNYDNVAKVWQRDIVEALEASQQKVSEALTTLAKRGYITVDSSRRPQVYSISPRLAQMGTHASRS